MSTPQPILIVLHQESSTPGRVGDALGRRGLRLDVRRPRFGDALPATMAEHAGAIIFGGPMSANDPDDFVRREIYWIAVPLRERKPFLGICLGAVYLAYHLGCPVDPHAEGQPPRSALRDPPDRPAARLRPWPSRSASGIAKVRAADRRQTCWREAMHFPYRRFALRTALQFHPDVTHATICRWTTRGHDRTLMPGAKPRAAHFADRAVHDPAGRAWLEAFLNHWLAQNAE